MTAGDKNEKRWVKAYYTGSGDIVLLQSAAHLFPMTHADAEAYLASEGAKYFVMELSDAALEKLNKCNRAIQEGAAMIEAANKRKARFAREFRIPAT